MRKPALLLALLAAACSSAAPATTRYLLPAETSRGTTRLESPARIGLGRVELSPYLGEEGLVVETAAGQVRPARYHVWAEPLDEGIRRLLRVEISKALGQHVSSDRTEQPRWKRTVDVAIDRLHGTLAGEAVLVARWRISPREGEPRAFGFSESRPLPREGYEGLVDAEIELTRALAQAIAESLQAP
ncbi:MAG: PqiC family protein [Myxococcota bacterium]|nr:PqiC family protein [Myxococcota bacterium]